jgi:hypothetical protein
MAPLWKVNNVCNRDCSKPLRCPKHYKVNKAHTKCVYKAPGDYEDDYEEEVPKAPQQEGIFSSLFKPAPAAPPQPPADYIQKYENKGQGNWQNIRDSIAKARAARLARERQADNSASGIWGPVASGADEFGGGARRRSYRKRKSSKSKRSSSKGRKQSARGRKRSNKRSRH